ncbi:ImmA/IrrE family metallo-endopeptidase [Lactobacillus rhamnosus]|uniref:ImmA/IrrE family metallo-endopeptidase n=1 Tax=Lacticaseibacillus rhamnosus TaxID=47715 RepID=A0A7Y7QH74_LACRH|nr:ImmA/IrrE family metallo-endopeptidase [Lacticaseibacillus rhamnosus]NVO88908.1 ImmA/IrrE family metallo-endopeptidase [Lacticaseibacillus rhamnosus]
MTDDYYLNEVLKYAVNHDVKYTLAYLLSPITPSTSNPKNRRIVINMNFHDQGQLAYQAAHEVRHVINEDSGRLYLFSASKNSIEGAANKGAIDILVPIYFDEIEEDDANVNCFLDALHIPYTMFDWAVQSIEDYYFERKYGY